LGEDPGPYEVVLQPFLLLATEKLFYKLGRGLRSCKTRIKLVIRPKPFFTPVNPTLIFDVFHTFKGATLEFSYNYPLTGNVIFIFRIQQGRNCINPVIPSLDNRTATSGRFLIYFVLQYCCNELPLPLIPSKRSDLFLNRTILNYILILRNPDSFSQIIFKNILPLRFTSERFLL